MKKLFVIIISIASSILVFGQDSTPTIPSSTQQSLEGNNNYALISFAPIFAIALVVILVIQVTRYILAHKLKNKIIDRGISEQLANSILEKSETDKKEDSIKWAILLLGVSGGLTAAYYTKPLDIHSIAIITFSIGLSYLAYYFYLRR